MTRRRHITSPGSTWHHLASLWVIQYILMPYTSLYKHPLAGVAMAAAAGRRSGATSCNAAAVKKKGVKVVHGKEIPWNLFSPKAPYQGKVVENDFHPQTLTEPTGDANWETTHVTFDHGGKAGCRMNQEGAACESLCWENCSGILAGPCNAMQCNAIQCHARASCSMILIVRSCFNNKHAICLGNIVGSRCLTSRGSPLVLSRLALTPDSNQ